ncbi:MAG: DNA (cytosine-5-)-methyltransferase [Crocosphaera sp.]|nr:DNA (cytosine-5-)-methyltransferase [Crocosphaera sp.]
MSINYIEQINNILQLKSLKSHLVVDLFAGCGGLSLGFEAQGFETYGLEKDQDCCYTYEQNLQGKCEQIELTINSKLPAASVIIGGPPCQPFSVGGKQKGLTDSRDGFPIFINAIKQVKPDIWLFENVRGLLYKNKWYFEEITQALQELGYIIEWKLLNSVCCKRPRDLHLDKPARTLTCRNLAGATGDMQRIKLPDGRRRRLSIREAARLQSFPDWFEFSGSETSCYNQIGNAVSPLLAFYLARSVRDYLESSYRLSSEELKKYTLPQQLSFSYLS